MSMLRKSVRGFTLVELMTVVAIIGILASVAIPAFMKYIRRSRTVEATMNLRRLYDSAAAYYMSEKGNSTGAIVQRQFPTSVVWSPDPGTCCGFASNKCAPFKNDLYGQAYSGNFSGTLSGSGWADPRWQALNFSIDDPHYFIYETVVLSTSPTYRNEGGTYTPGSFSTGEKVGDTFNIEASGDLNCDFLNYGPANPVANEGMSLYRRTMTVDNNFGVKGGAGLYVQRDLE